MASMEEYYMFGPHKVYKKEVFYSTEFSFAMVNLRPVLPDVLICPKRSVKRFTDLTSEETKDLWLTAHKVGNELEPYHNASSLTFTIQDGPQSGQTVPHVHIHILPRKVGDIFDNNAIYEALDEKDKELKQLLDLDKERNGTICTEDMAQEADKYRKLFL